MSDNLIDVHVLHMPDENQEWWNDCEKSLIGHPINVHNCSGINGNVGESRRLGFSLGSAPYVSFVDPDDLVLPNSFQVCLDVLEQHPEVCGVYTLSKVMNATGSISTNLLHPFRPWSFHNMKKCVVEVHQLVVMRRECVDDYHTLDYPTIEVTNMYSNVIMFWYMAIKKPWIAVDHIGYTWRNHSKGVHQVFNQNGDYTKYQDIISNIYNNIP